MVISCYFILVLTLYSAALQFTIVQISTIISHDTVNHIHLRESKRSCFFIEKKC